MFVTRPSSVKWLVSLYLSWASPGFSTISASEGEDYIRFLTRINTASPLEHAGSHGTLGLGVGMGLGIYHAAVNAKIMREHWRGPSQSVTDYRESTERVVLPRLYFYKGLPNSLDFGFSLAQDVKTKAKLWSGYGQWTPIEGFALPALALRSGFTRFMGLAATDVSSLSFDGVLSYGFFGLFTVYGSAGVARHQIEVRSGEEFGTTLALTSGGYGNLKTSLFNYNRGVGLQVQMIPGLATATTEVQISSDSRVSVAAKLSVGM